MREVKVEREVAGPGLRTNPTNLTKQRSRQQWAALKCRTDSHAPKLLQCSLLAVLLQPKMKMGNQESPERATGENKVGRGLVMGWLLGKGCRRSVASPCNLAVPWQLVWVWATNGRQERHDFNAHSHGWDGERSVRQAARDLAPLPQP